jgi:hypothetical protein
MTDINRFNLMNVENFSVDVSHSVALIYSPVSSVLMITFVQNPCIMKTNEVFNTLKSMTEKAMGTLKEEVSDLKDRWAPAAEEAGNRFEILKTDFKESLTAMESKLAAVLSADDARWTELRQKIDELKLQLALGKAESLEVFEEQQKKIQLQWSILKANLEKIPEYNSFQDEVKSAFNDWRVRLEIIKIQFSLGKMELKDNIRDISNDLGKELDHLGKAIEAGAGIAGEKFDRFESEVKKIFEKYRK